MERGSYHHNKLGEGKENPHVKAGGVEMWIMHTKRLRK